MIVSVVMHYRAPATGLPQWVIGIDNDPSAPYLLRTNLLVFAPLGGGIADATTRDGASIGLGWGVDHGHQVGTTTVELLPGQSTTVTFSVLGPPDAAGQPAAAAQPKLVLTPGVRPWTSSVAPIESCQPAS